MRAYCQYRALRSGQWDQILYCSERCRRSKK
ncbi:hypothetical protein [Vibrio brasiliensis]